MGLDGFCGVLPESAPKPVEAKRNNEIPMMAAEIRVFILFDITVS